jgi:hypothetical protein
MNTETRCVQMMQDLIRKLLNGEFEVGKLLEAVSSSYDHQPITEVLSTYLELALNGGVNELKLSRESTRRQVSTELAVQAMTAAASWLATAPEMYDVLFFRTHIEKSQLEGKVAELENELAEIKAQAETEPAAVD